MATAARVLYTKQVRKKSKTYNDGFLLISANGQAVLYDENGKELSTAASKLPYGLAADPAAAEDLSCFEGFLVQGDTACSPSDIAAARGSTAPDCSNKTTSSTSTAKVDTHGHGQQQAAPHHLTGTSTPHSCAGVLPKAPKAPQLAGSRRQHAVVPSEVSEAAGTAGSRHLQQGQAANLDNCLAGRCSSSNSTRANQQAAQHLGGTTSTRPCVDGAADVGNNISCAATLQSDMDILMLLESITPAGCSTWGGSGQFAAGQSAAHYQQQQQQQISRPLPAVPQFGRSRLPHQQQQQQQQGGHLPQDTPAATHQMRQGFACTPQAGAPRQQQQQQQHRNQADPLGLHPHQQQEQQSWTQAQPPFSAQGTAGTGGHANASAAAGGGAVAGPAAFRSARDAWATPQPSANSTGLESSSNQPRSAWNAGQGQSAALNQQQQQHQQQQQMQAHAMWQGQQQQPAAPQTFDGHGGFMCQPGASAGMNTAQEQPSRPLPQQGPRFNMPRPATADMSGIPAAAGALTAAQQQQQQQQRAGAQGYCFPGPGAGMPLRLVQVPDSFSSAQQYVQVLTAALTEEVNLQLAEQARTFHALVQQVQSAAAAQPAASIPYGQQQPQHQHQRFQPQQKHHQHQQPQHASRQHAGSDASSRLQAACARAGLRYHPGATLKVWNNNGSSSNNNRSKGSKAAWAKGRKRGRGQGDEADEEQEEEKEGGSTPAKDMSLYLTLHGKLDRRQFRKHDLWVLSNHPHLLKAADGAAAPYDRLSQPWVVLARSLWHGPDKDGKMEVELLPGQMQQLPANFKGQRQHSVTALQGPDVATDVQMADFISSSTNIIRGWQLLDSLLRPLLQSTPAGLPDAAAISSAASTAAAAATTACGAEAGAEDATALEGTDGSSNPGGNAAAEAEALDIAGDLDDVLWDHDCSPISNSERQPAAASSPSPSAAAATAAAATAADNTNNNSSSSQEFAAVPRRKRRCLLSAEGDSSSAEGFGDDDSSLLPAGRRSSKQAATGQAAAAGGVSTDSDWDDSDFEEQPERRPGKRIRRSAALAAAAGPERSADDCESSDSDAEPNSLGQQEAGAAAGAASPASGCEDTAAAQRLLADTVQQFELNPAQAAVAAHVASWLPQLQRDVRERAQQRPKRGAARLKSAPAATSTSRGNAAAAADSSNMLGGTAAAVEVLTPSSSSSSASPVCLIHGPFGSGKSTLLCALIHLLTSTQAGAAAAASDDAAQGRKATDAALTPRILVAAHTNVAVDRVLLGLMDAGFTNMLRVGSLPRIAKRLLGVSLHSADDSRDALSQLKGMLQGAAGVEEAMIRSEIMALQAGAERRRRRALSTAAVVGITCCSALQSTLEGQVFDVVLLDESSQMTEPTSLVPLLRTKPRFLIAAGDPCQLPPVLTSPTGVTPSGAAAAAAAALRSGHSLQHGGSNGRPESAGRQVVSHQQQQQQQQQQHSVVYGLLRPLFVRLTHLGYEPHLLTHQYRCHPMLSLLSNKHFYNSRLVDGVTATQRAPLLRDLPPLVLCDCQGGCSQAAGGGSRSSINKAEANLVAQLVLRLLQGPKAAAAPAAAGPAAAAATDQGVEPQGVSEASMQEVQQCNDDDDDDEGAGSYAAPVLGAHQLGVICFFRGQAALIKQLIAADASCPSAADVQVATVDSFQGAEKEVIILATTTTNPRSEFCSDGARLNVALTRARRHLVVVGAAAVLSQTPSAVFRELVSVTQSGQQQAAAFMPPGRLLQLLQ